jgi:Flp pilus assembly protein TadB
VFEKILLAAVASAALFGGTLLWAWRAERRRASLRERLNTIVVGASRVAEAPVLSLRRHAPQRKALPSMVAARLDVALAATGYQIGLLHVSVAGIVAAAAAGFLTLVADFRPVFAITLCIVASIGAPILLLQVTHRRYQRRFLDAFPDTLDLIIRAVRAGLPAAEAMEAVTRESRHPVRAEFQRMLAEMRIGTERWKKRFNTPPTASESRIFDFLWSVWCCSGKPAAVSWKRYPISVPSSASAKPCGKKPEL